MGEPVRVLLVDAHTLLRRCLATLLNRRRGLQVVGEAITGTQALDQARFLQPDVVVVDLGVPEGGPRLVSDLCRAASGCAVLVLTSSGDDSLAGRVLRAGARGYLQKSCEPDDLVHTIERLHLGELVVSPIVADLVLRALGGDGPRSSGLGGLTEREVDVLRQVALGRTNPEIARELCITEHTVKGHLAKILAKLQLGNRVQLATYALQHGLVLLPGADGAAVNGRHSRLASPLDATSTRPALASELG